MLNQLLLLVRRRITLGLIPLALLGAGYRATNRNMPSPPPAPTPVTPVAAPAVFGYEPRVMFDLSGYPLVGAGVKPWTGYEPLISLADAWRGSSRRGIERIDHDLVQAKNDDGVSTSLSLMKAALLNSEGNAADAYKALEVARTHASARSDVARMMLYSIIFAQGVASMRLGENENCVMCRGESSCILPISATAVHLKPSGSRTAIKHFTEYLEKFPDDLEVRWLLNVAHMTLGEHPAKVDPRYVISLDRFVKSEFNIGRFRDIGHLLGVNRLNQAGGAIMDDFDDDGRLDIVISTFDPTGEMVFYHNKGDGTFEDRTQSTGLTGQLGGLVCYQADYNNDGKMDIFVPRGAWLPHPVRPTLLRNDGGMFTDVTAEAKLLEPFNSNAAAWADYDNDGFVDLFIACEKQVNRLYHNRGDGTFEEIAGRAKVAGNGKVFGKGATWIDYDNDNYPDLFINNLSAAGQLFHNQRDGTFDEVTVPMGINGPMHGFSCWTWDYDNDGYLDIFATCYDRTLGDVVKGLIGKNHKGNYGRLFRNVRGERFEDVSKSVGLTDVYSAMGSNFADFDNDGYLDFYLGTGEPNLATLIPNRMFKNVGGQRFSEITGTAGTGHLQKGHGVAIGDWDSDGDSDIFIEMGGAVDGDKYHNILFQNPGQGNHWLTVKLVGEKTNRAAIGARIKAITTGNEPLTVQRHVSSGSSFGANPLRQTLGLGKADQVATLEIYWPTSKTTQVFHDIPANQAIEITELAADFRRLDSTPIPTPAE